AAARMRAGWANVLAPGIRRIFEKIRAPFSRLHRECAIGHWEIVSSYSSATAPGLHGISCVSSLIQIAKNCGVDKRRKNATQDFSFTHPRAGPDIEYVWIGNKRSPQARRSPAARCIMSIP